VVQLSLSLPRNNRLKVVASTKNELIGNSASEQELSVFQQGKITSKTFTDPQQQKRW